MALRLTRSTLSKKGTSEVSTSVIEKESVIIGRGGESDILLEGSAISLQHAKISQAQDSYVIEDLDSLSGLKINDKLVRRHVLKKGDVVKLGDYSFSVISSTRLLELTEAPRTAKVSAEDALQRDIDKLNFRAAFPSIKALSWIGILAVAAFSAYPYFSENKMSWSSGTLTNHHRMIETNCGSCHEGNFSKVNDAKCQSCHQLSEHAKAFSDASSAHKDLMQRPCVDCHREHEGEQALIAKQSTLCTTCHATIKTVLADSKLADVSSWEEHPEFALPAIDSTRLKLNHELHLKPGLRGKDGPVTLACGDCHALTTDRRSIQPITMEKNCSSCHPLGFDERLPDAAVPHGKPDLVYAYLYAEYAKLLLDPDNSSASEGFRQRPGEQREAAANPAFARGEIVKLARSAEQELFTRTACKLCHEIQTLSDVSSESKRSRFEVLEPNLPSSWMPASHFSHGAHDEVACESCHHDVQTSTKTQDILLPKIKDCKACHAGHSVAGKIASNCIDCHSFHDSLPLDSTKKRSLENIVTSLGTR